MNGQRHTNKICLLGAGEASTYGVIAGGIETSTYYNNHDISFHNMIWATAMQGGCTTGQDWQWPIIHRWKDANPDKINGTPIPHEIGNNFSFSPANGNPVSDEIETCFHHYKPLSDFIASSQMDFNGILEPKKVYDDASNENVECYYLVNSYQTRAYGWVHNLLKYWGNNYYYNAAHENYYGCEYLASTPATSVELPGFVPNQQYLVQFYATRWNNPSLPTNYYATTTSGGNLILDLSTQPLTCDTSYSDYAFAIDIIPFANRLANKTEEKKITNEFDFSIVPNPNTGKFTLLFSRPGNNQTITIEVYDIAGKKIISKQRGWVLSQILDLSYMSKGIYYVKISINSISPKIKKLVIN